MEATIAITSRLQRRSIEMYLSDLDLNLTQALIVRYLNYLTEHDGWFLNQTELADRLQLKKPATGAAVEVLQARGLVTRTTAAGDRRAVLLAVTPEGRIVAEDIELRMQLASQAFTQGIDEESLVTFQTVLATIYRNLADIEASDGPSLPAPHASSPV